MIRSLILSCYLINLSFASFLMSLVVSILLIFPLLGKTNSQPKPQSVFLGYSCLQRGYLCYSPDINHYFIFADVTFFKDSSFFSSVARPPVSDVLSIPRLTISRFPFSTYRCHDSITSGLYSLSSSSYRASC